MLTKADEQKGLEDKCAEQMAEIKSLNALVSFLYVLKTIYSHFSLPCFFTLFAFPLGHNDFFLWNPSYEALNSSACLVFLSSAICKCLNGLL